MLVNFSGIPIKIKLFCISLLCFNLIFAQEKLSDEERTMYFPKDTVYLDNIPAQDKLWVFIMAGQSNMAGRGFVEPQDTIYNKRILSLNKQNKWIYAKEPLHFYEPALKGLDCGLAFANALLDSIPKGVTVALVPCALGGSSIKQWIDDEFYRGVNLLSNFRERVEFAQKFGQIKGILWHQGESDSGSEGISGYYAHLDTLFTKFRSIAKDDSLPVLMGELGTFAEPAEKQMRRDSINMIIHDFAKKNKRISVIPTDDLTDRGDKLHFDSKSQRIMGERFALEYILSFL